MTEFLVLTAGVILLAFAALGPIQSAATHVADTLASEISGQAGEPTGPDFAAKFLVVSEETN